MKEVMRVKDWFCLEVVRLFRVVIQCWEIDECTELDDDGVFLVV